MSALSFPFLASAIDSLSLYDDKCRKIASQHLFPVVYHSLYSPGAINPSTQLHIMQRPEPPPSHRTNAAITHLFLLVILLCLSHLTCLLLVVVA